VNYFGLPCPLHHLSTLEDPIEFKASILIHGREWSQTQVPVPYTSELGIGHKREWGHVWDSVSRNLLWLCRQWFMWQSDICHGAGFYVFQGMWMHRGDAHDSVREQMLYIECMCISRTTYVHLMKEHRSGGSLSCRCCIFVVLLIAPRMNSTSPLHPPGPFDLRHAAACFSRGRL